MKIRTDFVTNSSSSNFIIAYKSMPQFDDETLKKYPFLKSFRIILERMLLVEESGRYDSGKEIFTLKGFEGYYLERYGYEGLNTMDKIFEDHEYVQKEYVKYRALLENGYRLILKEVDYSDESCLALLADLIESENDFIIVDET